MRDIDVTAFFTRQAVPPGWKVVIEVLESTSPAIIDGDGNYSVVVWDAENNFAGRLEAPVERRMREVRFMDVFRQERKTHSVPAAIEAIVNTASAAMIKRRG